MLLGMAVAARLVSSFGTSAELNSMHRASGRSVQNVDSVKMLTLSETGL